MRFANFLFIFIAWWNLFVIISASRLAGNFHHPLASEFYDRPDSRFCLTVAPGIPCATCHEVRFYTLKPPSWSTTSFSIHFHLTGRPRKAPAPPLVAKHLSLSHIQNIRCKRVEVYTDESTTADESTAALSILKLSAVGGF